MLGLNSWVGALLTFGMGVLAILLVVWWRQHTFRWPIIAVVCVALAPALSWWSGQAFQVPDYRAGCDGLCLGYSGAPVPIYAGESAGGHLLVSMFALNTAIYMVLLLGWAGIVRSIMRRVETAGNSPEWMRGLLIAGLLIGPVALAPLYLPPPEAHVRGDPQRIAINARREIYMYDDFAPMPVLRAALEDVRPRNDGRPGMRVCLRIYTYFYLPTGHMYLDMTPEGVHSNEGGVLPMEASCWPQ